MQDFGDITKLVYKLANNHALSVEEYELLVSAVVQEKSAQGASEQAKSALELKAPELSEQKSSTDFLLQNTDEQKSPTASPQESEQNLSGALIEQAKRLAVEKRKQYYGNTVFSRGLIEFSNYCKNDCLYCGLRKSHKVCNRYRLTQEEILACANQGYELGFRTFVLQSGEDPWFSDERLGKIVSALKNTHPDCAITLSVGERSRQSYQYLFDAGVDRYLLRHETASASLYKKWHPEEMSFENRMRCLRDLKEIGYTVGCGFMIGAPYQTPHDLALDLKFIEEFKPDMCGIGPFVPHHATPFASAEQGSVALTCFLLSLIRLIRPNILLPATTALGTLDSQGREKGILSGANVVMPNLSPTSVRKQYEIYDNKICTGEEAAECRLCLNARIAQIGYEVVVDRGDPRFKQGLTGWKLR